jgi:hypothetical protein
VRIVGIALVRDEDVFVDQAVRNASAFCDEFQLYDHQSRDDTPRILERLAAELPNTTFERIADPAITHDRLRPYIGTDTWIFAVDGDELYHPGSLKVMRERMETGEFADCFLIKGMQLHCRAIDHDAGTAAGWLAPPSRSTTMLYNFEPLSGWDGRPPERLMGDGARFARPMGTRWLRDEHPWDEAPMRCLHVCFLRRSSRQPEGHTARLSYVERIADGRRAKLRRRFGELLGRPPESWWKLNKYRQGPETSVSIAGFF